MHRVWHPVTVAGTLTKKIRECVSARTLAHGHVIWISKRTGKLGRDRQWRDCASAGLARTRSRNWRADNMRHFPRRIDDHNARQVRPV